MRLRSVMLTLLLITAALVGDSRAIVPSTQAQQAVAQRVSEIDASLATINTSLAQANLSTKEQKDLNEMKSSLEEERRLLLERAELLKRLEKQGLLIYVSPDSAQSPPRAASRRGDAHEMARAVGAQLEPARQGEGAALPAALLVRLKREKQKV